SAAALLPCNGFARHRAGSARRPQRGELESPPSARGSDPIPSLGQERKRSPPACIGARAAGQRTLAAGGAYVLSRYGGSELGVICRRCRRIEASHYYSASPVVARSPEHTGPGGDASASTGAGSEGATCCRSSRRGVAGGLVCRKRCPVVEVFGPGIRAGRGDRGGGSADCRPRVGWSLASLSTRTSRNCRRADGSDPCR